MAVIFAVGDHGVAAAVLGVLFLSVAAMHRHGVAGAAAAAAVHHHVVGGDPGWDVASDVLAWSAGRLFTVGDTLWFAYAAADGGVAEVGGEAEFESCEAGDPVRTYTEGLTAVGLDSEGSRYFVSADPARCKSGLKLRVDVLAPVLAASPQAEDRAAAPAPAPAPSASRGSRGAASLTGVALSLIGVWCFGFLVLGI